MEINKLFIQPFEFSGFLNTKWDNFVHKILAEAHHHAQEASYSMGGGEVPKINLLPGEYTADQKHFTQFHPDTLNHAVHRRYGRDLLRLGQHWDVHKKLPKENRADFHDLEARRTGKPKKEYQGRTAVRRYKNVLSDILTDEEYKGLDDEQKAAYDEAKNDSSKLVHVTDPDTGEVTPKLKLRIYTGHSHLGHALSAPAKVIADQHENPNNTKFKPGIGLNDIAMIDGETGAIIEPGHPKYEEQSKKLKEYLGDGHGLYDFNLAHVLLVPREKFLNMEDWKIVRALDTRWQQVFATLPNDERNDGSWKYNTDILQSDPQYNQLIEKIKEKRNRMIKEPGHSMAGFEPIKNEKATGMLTDWMRANALGILGPRPKEGELVKDPVTGKMVKVHLMPYEKAKKYFGERNLTVGFNPNMVRGANKKPAHPGDITKLDIPVIPRWVSYEELSVLFPDGVNAGDAEGGEEKSIGPPNKTEKIFVPYLHDTKILPKINWSETQKAIMAHRALPNLVPGFEETKNEKLTDAQIEEIVRRYKNAADERVQVEKEKFKLTPNAEAVRAAVNSKDIANILNNWDLLTDEQKEHVTKNSRNLLQHAKAMHGGPETADYHSHANFSHNMGYSVNKASPGMPHLNLNAEQIKQVEQKYDKDITEEAVVGVNRWFYGYAVGNQILKKGKQGGTKDQVVGNFNTPQYVAQAMWSMSTDLMGIAKIYLYCYLNDPDIGIYDPEVGLTDTNKSKAIMKWANKGFPEKGGKEPRILKVQALLSLLSQSQIDTVPPRRHRTDNAIEIQGGEDAEGNAFDPQAGGKERTAASSNIRYSRRGAKLPEGMLVNAKGALGNVEMPRIVQNIRQMVQQNLGGKGAERITLLSHRLDAMIKMEGDLKTQYDEEFAKEENPDGSLKYKTNKEREKAVDAHVQSMLRDKLKLGGKDIFGYMTQNEREDLMTQLKQKKGEYVDLNFEQDNPNYAEEFSNTMDEFWNKILNSDGAHVILPQYNVEEKKFEDGNIEISLQTFINDGPTADGEDGEPVSPAKFVEIIQELYNTVAQQATSKLKVAVKDDLKHFAPQVYRGVLRLTRHYNNDSLENINKLLLQAGLGRDETAPVQQQPAQPQQQQQQQPQRQPQMAANVIDGLLSGLTKRVGQEDFIKLVDNLAAKVEELKTSPNRKVIAGKIKATYDTIAKIRNEMLMADKLTYNRSEATAFNKLELLYKALEF